MTTKGYRVSFWGNEKVLELDIGDGRSFVNVSKTLNCTLLKIESYGI